MTPVIEQTKTVSNNGPKAATRPSCTGSLVEDWPWYMGAFPTPLSLEKTARLTPKRINPQKPPVTAVFRLKASEKIDDKAGSTRE